MKSKNGLTHIQGLIGNYQVEALPESEDSSSGFLSDGTSHDVGVPSEWILIGTRGHEVYFVAISCWNK